MHCELLINGGRLLLHNEFPENGHSSPLSLGGTAVTLHLYVSDVDATFSDAVSAGAEALMPPTDAFWGDRYAIVRDPFRPSLVAGHPTRGPFRRRTRGALRPLGHCQPSGDGGPARTAPAGAAAVGMTIVFDDVRADPPLTLCASTSNR